MSEREWLFYLQDMLRFANKVQQYSAGMDQAAFEQDELRYDAILRNLELIGEGRNPRAERRARGSSVAAVEAGHRHLQPPDTGIPGHR